MPIKYCAYMAIVCAVMLDLYSARPGTDGLIRVAMDGTALLFAVMGLGGLAIGPRRR